MASSLLDYFGMPEDDEQMDYSSSLLGRPKRKYSGPDMGMLGLAAGLLEPTANGQLGPAFANGLKGWAGGVAAQRKLDEADAENDPQALMQKYMAQAKIKAQIAKEYPDAEGWGMAPFVDSTGNVYQLGNRGSIRQLTDMHGRFTPPTTVDTGGSLRVINPSNPTHPLADIPKSLNPGQALDNRPDRFTQTPNPDGSFTQTDTNTGKQDLVANPNAPKNPPAEFSQRLGAFDAFDGQLNKYIDSLKTRDRVRSVIPGSNEYLGLDQAHGDLMLTLKDIYGLGVLNKGDMPQLERQLKNPVAPSSTLYNNDDLIKQAEEVRNTINQKRRSLEESYQSSGFKVGQPGLKGAVGKTTIDIGNLDEAKRAYDALPMGSPGKEELGQAIANAMDSKVPYSVNKSSVPALKKPSAMDLDAARRKIAEFASDPNAQSQVRDMVIKRMQDAGYDTAGL
jgi:hypothetical protein